MVKPALLSNPVPVPLQTMAPGTLYRLPPNLDSPAINAEWCWEAAAILGWLQAPTKSHKMMYSKVPLALHFSDLFTHSFLLPAMSCYGGTTCYRSSEGGMDEGITAAVGPQLLVLLHHGEFHLDLSYDILAYSSL